ncbi:MAG: hypothetical protein IKX65_11475 [Prevotella sp.]|nr:hypothetical protein [Prevotella sp.]
MKGNILVLAVMFGFIPLSIKAQKKPTIMILPSDNWCEMRYFMTTYDNQGTKVKTPDYQLAFQQDTEIGPVISKIGGLLTSLDYSIKDAEQEIKSINLRTAEDNVTYSKTSGASLVESPLDVLKRRIKSDVLIQISWHINKEIGGRSISFNLEAFDTYTSKRIASSTGTTLPSYDPIPVMLEQAVKERIAEFDALMMKWYQDQETNGREIILTIRCWDNWENDLETEYDGEELTDCIQDWLKQHTVSGNYSLSDGTESFAQFEQVRIPLFDERGNALDARGFATQLRKYLNRPPFNITSKVMQRGLGEAIIVLGEK